VRNGGSKMEIVEMKFRERRKGFLLILKTKGLEFGVI